MPQLEHPHFKVPGFRAGAVSCGLKSGRPDLAMLVSDEPNTKIALTTTQNAFAAAPVHITRQHAAGGARAIVINSGNANACTGRQGLRDALTMASQTAEALGLRTEDVLVASTGVIGHPLPMDLVSAGIRECGQSLGDDGAHAAQAILTTDSGPKIAMMHCEIDGKTITLAGMAKGSGMIHPNMATMLGFVATDAAVDQASLQGAFQQAVTLSFNQISVDACESTNDMAILMANGRAGNAPLNPDHPDWDRFQETLTELSCKLAQMIAADGEGATRMIEAIVDGANSDEQARVLARAIVASPLVKAAVHGGDPNWGRILSAAGQADASLDAERVQLHVGPEGDEVCLLLNGTPQDDAGANARLARATARIRLSIGFKTGTGRAWGCDLTPDYVSFNAHYTT